MPITSKSVKVFSIAICLLIVSCVNNADRKKTTIPHKPPKHEIVKDDGFHWTGTINTNIPVSLNYTIKGSLITGCIIYLNTKNKAPIKIIGTIGDITFYKREGTHYAKGKSTLSGERVKNSPEFERTMFHAGLMERGSPIASEVYKTFPKNSRKRWMFNALTGEAMRML